VAAYRRHSSVAVFPSMSLECLTGTEAPQKENSRRNKYG
jgi:hypothetical protein